MSGEFFRSGCQQTGVPWAAGAVKYGCLAGLVDRHLIGRRGPSGLDDGVPQAVWRTPVAMIGVDGWRVGSGRSAGLRNCNLAARHARDSRTRIWVLALAV